MLFDTIAPYLLLPSRPDGASRGQTDGRSHSGLDGFLHQMHSRHDSARSTNSWLSVPRDLTYGLGPDLLPPLFLPYGVPDDRDVVPPDDEQA